MISLADEAATADVAGALASALPDGFFYIALEGGLGAGKTHTVRCLLRALGETGTVRSPTYTLMEDYETPLRRVLHLDLYRLADAEELEFLGLREWIGQNVLLCVEWPDKGAGALPVADLTLRLEIVAGEERLMTLRAGSAAGEVMLQRLLVPADSVLRHIDDV